MVNEITLEHVNDLYVPNRRLGKAPAIGHPKMLLLGDYLKAEPVVPTKTSFWKNRAPFPVRSFGNTEHGDCTRAKQALFAVRLQRIEERVTRDFATDEVLRVYYAMTSRLYGGGDTGAYEIDALSEWRKPDLTFRDTKGNPHTIDGFVRINQFDLNEVKKAVALSAAHGVAICFNLPWAWSRTWVWDAPKPEEQYNMDWVPGSWGGHSMAFVNDYNANGFTLDHTWNVTPGFVTWDGFRKYCDEAYMVFDTLKVRKAPKNIDYSKLISDINQVSSQKVAA